MSQRAIGDWGLKRSPRTLVRHALLLTWHLASSSRGFLGRPASRLASRLAATPRATPTET